MITSKMKIVTEFYKTRNLASSFIKLTIAGRVPSFILTEDIISAEFNNLNLEIPDTLPWVVVYLWYGSFARYLYCISGAQLCPH